MRVQLHHTFTLERLWGTSTIHTQLLFGQNNVMQVAVKVGRRTKGEAVVKDEQKNTTITADGDRQLKEKKMTIGEVLVRNLSRAGGRVTSTGSRRGQIRGV